MKRLVILFACFVAGLCFVIVPSAIADKPPAPPGQGECNHGNSNQPCKPDPQPEHGKDCDPHGNNGGVNEDHCLTTTSGTTTTNEITTTNETTTTNQTTTKETTSTRTETTPQTTSTPTGTSDKTTSVGATTSIEGTTSVETTTPLPTPKCDDGSIPPCPTPDAAPPLKQERKAQKASGKLPFTGIPLVLVVALGLAQLGIGLTLRRKTQ